MRRSIFHGKRRSPQTYRMLLLERENIALDRRLRELRRWMHELERRVNEQQTVNAQFKADLDRCIRENDSIEVIEYAEPATRAHGYSIRRASDREAELAVCGIDRFGRW